METSSEGGHVHEREERWRLALLAAVLAVAGTLLMGLRDKPVLKGEVDPASHVDTKRKQEAAQRKKEIDLRFKEGVAMLQAKAYDKALIAFHRVLELAPDMPEALVNAGYASLGLGDAKSARVFFDSATNLRPDQLNAYFGLGEALLALGDTLGALQAMETYIHRAPADDPFRRKAEAAAWELRGKWERESARFSAAGGTAVGSSVGGKP